MLLTYFTSSGSKIPVDDVNFKLQTVSQIIAHISISFLHYHTSYHPLPSKSSSELRPIYARATENWNLVFVFICNLKDVGNVGCTGMLIVLIHAFKYYPFLQI